MPVIRPVEKTDVPRILEIYAPYILNTAVSFEEQVPGEDQFWERIKEVTREAPWMVCELSGLITGYGYASPHRGRAAYRWNRELSAYVSDRYFRKGIGRALYISLLEIIRLQGYLNALAGITLPNPASVAFHESMGFKKVGVYHKIGYKFGKTTDTGWWEMCIQDDDFIPGPIRPLKEITGSYEWDQAIHKGLQQLKLNIGG